MELGLKAQFHDLWSMTSSRQGYTPFLLAVGFLKIPSNTDVTLNWEDSYAWAFVAVSRKYNFSRATWRVEQVHNLETYL